MNSIYEIYENEYYENDIDWNYIPYQEKERDKQLEFSFMKETKAYSKDNVCE